MPSFCPIQSSKKGRGSAIPERPPGRWFNEKVREIKRGLREAHPDWKPDTVTERAEATVGDLWHHRLDPSKKREILRREEKSLDVARVTVLRTLMALKGAREELDKEFEKERREHMTMGDQQVAQIVRDHATRSGLAREAAEWGPRTKGFRPMVSHRYALFMPARLKTVGDPMRGNVFVEGYINMPIKDLQGDLLEMSALHQASAAMVTAPHDLVWLDHHSPYASPMYNDAPPIGRFVKSKIMKVRGVPALWARMLMNKVHPDFLKTFYELKNKFRNAFSMEFMPLPGCEMLKTVGNKVVNAISGIKYFACSLVRAPANEGAVTTRVYVKAFANSSEFCPVLLKGVGWIGQSVMEKKKMSFKGMFRRKEPDPDADPDPDPDADPDPEVGFPAERRDFDRQTGTTAAERASSGLGEWGDPIQRRGTPAEGEEEEEEEEGLEERVKGLESAVRTMVKQNALTNKGLMVIGKALGLPLDLKGIDEDTLEIMGEKDASTKLEELDVFEPAYGRMGKPKRQRVITAIESDDPEVEEVDTQEVGAKSLGRFIVKTVNRAVEDAFARRNVVRKGLNEGSGPIPEGIRAAQRIANDDGSIESQLDIIDAFKT